MRKHYSFLSLALSLLCTNITAVPQRNIEMILSDVLEQSNLIPRRAKAFPGAEGFGAYTQGGCDGTKLLVTSLKDDGSEGTLRWAISQNFPRIIEFAVEGVITLQSDLVINNPCITIDASKATGSGITLKDGCLKVQGTHDVIIRHLRIRPGDQVALHKGQWANSTRSETPKNAINIEDSAYVLLDHCSAAWSANEVLSTTHSDYVTVQWCFIYEPLANPNLHQEQDQAPYARGAILNGHHVSYIKNLIAYYQIHGPQLIGETESQLEFANNLMFGYEKAGTEISLPSSDRFISFQLVNNAYEKQLSDNAPQLYLSKEDSNATFPDSYEKIKIFLSSVNKATRIANWLQIASDLNVTQINSVKSNKALFRSNVNPLLTTVIVKENILINAGALPMSRDEHDLRIIDQIRNNTGTIINSQDDVNGYPIDNTPDNVPDNTPTPPDNTPVLDDLTTALLIFG